MTLGVVYALGRVFGIIRPGGGAGAAPCDFRPSRAWAVRGGNRRRARGRGDGSRIAPWEAGRSGSRTSTAPPLGATLAARWTRLAEPTYSGGLSERAANERKAKEAKERREAKAAEDAAEPRWWDPPSPGYCPESQREQRLLAARAVYAALSNKRVSGLRYNEGDLAALRERVRRREGDRRGSRQARERQGGHLQVGGGVRDRRGGQAEQHGRHRGAHEVSHGHRRRRGDPPRERLGGSSPPPSPREREPSCSKPARSFDRTSRAPR